MKISLALSILVSIFSAFPALAASAPTVCLRVGAMDSKLQYLAIRIYADPSGSFTAEAQRVFQWRHSITPLDGQTAANISVQHRHFCGDLNTYKGSQFDLETGFGDTDEPYAIGHLNAVIDGQNINEDVFDLTGDNSPFCQEQR